MTDVIEVVNSVSEESNENYIKRLSVSAFEIVSVYGFIFQPFAIVEVISISIVLRLYVFQPFEIVIERRVLFESLRSK